MCSVKAIVSSVERLLRYGNCSGSSEAGSTEQIIKLANNILLKKCVCVCVSQTDILLLCVRRAQSRT